MAHDWICPHCDKAQVIGDESKQGNHIHIDLEVAEGSVGFAYNAIRCSNFACNALTFFIKVANDYETGYDWRFRSTGATLFAGTLIPQAKIRTFPPVIPVPIIDDYREACLISDLSPKASATLSRRCLQGMIRDFAGIRKNRLVDEISALRQQVDEGTATQGITMDSVDAIDHVRGVGNIGAHMEKDIDLIVPVDPGEAQALIELIEMLFAEWYVARATRQDRLAKIAQIGSKKEEARKAAKAAKPAAAEGSTDSPAKGQDPG